MKNTGKGSEADFEARLLARYGKCVFIYRIPDQADSYGRNARLVLEDPRPSDYIVTINGVMAYAECKSTHEPRFAKSMLRARQLGAMKRQIAAGGNYDVYVHDKTNDRWYVVSGYEFLAEPERKSWKFSELREWKL